MNNIVLRHMVRQVRDKDFASEISIGPSAASMVGGTGANEEEATPCFGADQVATSADLFLFRNAEEIRQTHKRYREFYEHKQSAIFKKLLDRREELASNQYNFRPEINRLSAAVAAEEQLSMKGSLYEEKLEARAQQARRKQSASSLMQKKGDGKPGRAAIENKSPSTRSAFVSPRYSEPRKKPTAEASAERYKSQPSG